MHQLLNSHFKDIKEYLTSIEQPLKQNDVKQIESQKVPLG